MSSAVLYLAIVALWAVVLVPMWLRRDADQARHGFSWLPHHRRSETAAQSGESALETAAFHDVGIGDHPDGIDDSGADERDRPMRRHGGRGAVIARRRRRTLGLSLLFLASTAMAIAGAAPFWVAVPPAGLLAGHLSLLRVAAGIDAARRAEAAQARAEARAEARAAEEAAQAAHAVIIDLMERNRARDVFDQYAHEGLRAVGD